MARKPCSYMSIYAQALYMAFVMKTKSIRPFVLVAYSILFYLFWAFKELTFSTFLANYGVSELTQELVNAFIKLLIWVLPAMLLLRGNSGSVLAPIKNMFTNKFRIVDFLPITLVFVVYMLFAAIRQNGSIGIAEFSPYSLIGTVLVAGIAEELVFRGFLLNTTYKRMGRNKAFALNALMFLVIHFPIWIAKGTFLNNFATGSFVIIILLSLVFSWAFEKSKNICVPIFLHMLWNLLILLFVGG